MGLACGSAKNFKQRVCRVGWGQPRAVVSVRVVAKLCCFGLNAAVLRRASSGAARTLAPLAPPSTPCIQRRALRDAKFLTHQPSVDRPCTTGGQKICCRLLLVNFTLKNRKFFVCMEFISGNIFGSLFSKIDRVVRFTYVGTVFQVLLTLTLIGNVFCTTRKAMVAVHFC